MSKEKTEKVNRLLSYDTEKLQKELKVCRKLFVVFLVVGIVFTIGGGFLFFYGLAHVWAAILAILFSGGHADVGEIMNTAGYMFIAGFPIFLMGIGSLTAGVIVTSLKIVHRKKELIRRGEPFKKEECK